MSESARWNIPVSLTIIHVVWYKHFLASPSEHVILYYTDVVSFNIQSNNVTILIWIQRLYMVNICVVALYGRLQNDTCFVAKPSSKMC